LNTKQDALDVEQFRAVARRESLWSPIWHLPPGVEPAGRRRIAARVVDERGLDRSDERAAEADRVHRLHLTGEGDAAVAMTAEDGRSNDHRRKIDCTLITATARPGPGEEGR
jgi:hypothetical protein